MSNKLEAVVSANVSQFQTAMTNVGLVSSNAASVALGAFAAITAALFGMESQVLGTATSYQLLRQRLQFVLRDAKKGAEVFEEIKKKTAESSLETQPFISSYIKLTSMLKNPPGIDFVEGIGFAAKGAGKNFEDTARAVGKLINRLEEGRPAGEEIIEMLLGVVDNKFIERLRRGQVSVADVTKEFLKLQKIGKQTLEQGADAALKRLAGSFSLLKNEIGGGRNIESYEKLLNAITSILDEVRKSDAVKDLREAFALLLDSMLEMAKNGTLKKFLLDILNITNKLVSAIALLIELVNTLLNLPGVKQIGQLQSTLLGAKLPEKASNSLANFGAEAMIKLTGDDSTKKALDSISYNTKNIDKNTIVFYE